MRLESHTTFAKPWTLWQLVVITCFKYATSGLVCDMLQYGTGSQVKNQQMWSTISVTQRPFEVCLTTTCLFFNHSNVYFLIVSQQLRSREQINTAASMHHPAGRYHIVGFCANAAKRTLRPVHCGSVYDTGRRMRREMWCNRDAVFFYRVLTSHCARCYWLGGRGRATHQVEAQDCAKHSREYRRCTGSLQCRTLLVDHKRWRRGIILV